MPTLLDTGSYAVQLLQATGALIVVCVLAFILLRFAARSGLGSGQNRLIHVVERVALSPRPGRGSGPCWQTICSGRSERRGKSLTFVISRPMRSRRPSAPNRVQSSPTCSSGWRRSERTAYTTRRLDHALGWAFDSAVRVHAGYELHQDQRCLFRSCAAGLVRSRSHRGWSSARSLFFSPFT